MITANFEIKTYYLNVSSTAGGSVVNPGESNYTYDHGTDVNLEAVADDGYHFLRWTGDNGTITDTTTNDTTITMEGDYMITAEFEINTYYLNVTSTANGSVINPGEDNYTYDHGTVVDLEAVADENYTFNKWSGDNGTVTDTTANQTDITMEGDYMITANFELNTYTLTISIDGEGTEVNYGEGEHTFDHGTEVNLTAENVTGWEFQNWTGDESSDNMTMIFTITEDMGITAHFVETDDDDNSGGGGGGGGTTTERREVNMNVNVNAEGTLDEEMANQIKRRGETHKEIKKAVEGGR